METPASSRVRFGAFELNVSTGELRSTDTAESKDVLLREQAFQVLLMLVERPRKIVSREEIKGRLWPNDTVVDFDQSINATIKTLRRALGDSADNPRYIETLARRGYRLMVDTEYLESASGTARDYPAAAAATTEPHGLIGRKVSHYRVVDVIGGGGMGMVYRAEDLKLGRGVALKFLPEELASDAVALQRFEREAQTASSLNHPNICTVYAIDEHEGKPFIVMELLEGDTLRSRVDALKPKPLPFDELSEIAMQVCDGLQAAHLKGIIHRDIKPANIFVCTLGVVKILDFGLAKLASGTVGLEKAVAATASADSHADRLKRDLTRTGATAGTAGYMSPEQARHEELDTRTDLFSLGLVLYEMASGQRAFTGETVLDAHEAILHQTPVPARLRNPMLPRGFDALLAKALEKDRERRYQSATAVKDDLERLVREANPRKRRARQALAAIALLAVVALGIWRYDVYRHRITLGPTDTIVLADVNNQTGDPVFEDALNTALRYEMAQTPYLNVLGIDKVYATLAELKLPLTTKIAPDVALQICGKTNSKMVISQSIADAGNGYHLQMRALDCGSGATLAEEREDINSRNEVIHELGVTAVRLREKLGEPSDSLARFNQPLEKELSASLEALQASTEGTKLHLAGDLPAALKLYQQAVELDPNMALIYGGIGAVYASQKNDEVSAPSFTRAYQLRERLTEKDQLNTEFLYYAAVIGDLEKAYSSLVRLLQIFPRDVFAHINLGTTLAKLGQPDRAADEAAEAVRLQPSSYYLYDAILNSRLASRFSEAKSLLTKADDLKFDNLLIRREELIVALATGDRDTVARVLKDEERGSDRENFLLQHFLIEIHQGRFHSAERLGAQALQSASGAFEFEWRSALANAEVGRSVQARRDESRIDQRKLGRDDKLALALTLARSGRTEEAGKLADQISAERPQDTLVQNYLVPSIRAAVKLQQHDPAAAIDLLRASVKYDLAYTGSFDYVYPPYIRGIAYLELGDGRSAAAQFQKLIDNPGLTVNHVTGPLAWLQLGRAQKMIGDKAAARKSYETFLDLWKDADPDIPIFQQAKTEYAKLSS
jgi:eukaryotic-like serine/threonine-protein kinase